MAVQNCVVCGRPSSRASWANNGVANGTSWIACDFHSRSAVEQAVLANPPTLSQPGSKNVPKTIHEPWGQ